MAQPPIEQIIDNALKTKTLEVSQIPSIDLYMDQVITLLNNHTGFAVGREEPLTKTMINNYRKEDIISPMKGKRYSKDQIYQILFIYYLKQSMPISDIKVVLQSLKENETDMEALYSRFLKEQDSAKEIIRENLLNQKVTKREDLAALLLKLSSVVGLLEHLSEELVTILLRGDK